MKLIVGLGNPGFKYTNSRHNVGFAVLKALAAEKRAGFKRSILNRSFLAKIRYEGSLVILAMPHTYMNLSGSAVKRLAGKFNVGLEELLVVCDDMDLELGRIKIRPKGSSGGHRGLQSIIDSLKSDNFSRLRVGIGRPAQDLDPSEYVLDSFSRKEKIYLKDAIERAASSALSWVLKGVAETMNTFNRNTVELERRA
ncbi:MAG: aminoacyl-tRNA hydrolase [Candidatus Omnitrophota bacterium]